MTTTEIIATLRALAQDREGMDCAGYSTKFREQCRREAAALLAACELLEGLPVATAPQRAENVRFIIRRDAHDQWYAGTGRGPIWTHHRGDARFVLADDLAETMAACGCFVTAELAPATMKPE